MLVTLDVGITMGYVDNLPQRLDVLVGVHRYRAFLKS
jgi:hypothetical protein